MANVCLGRSCRSLAHTCNSSHLCLCLHYMELPCRAVTQEHILQVRASPLHLVGRCKLDPTLLHACVLLLMCTHTHTLTQAHTLALCSCSQCAWRFKSLAPATCSAYAAQIQVDGFRGTQARAGCPLCRHGWQRSCAKKNGLGQHCTHGSPVYLMIHVLQHHFCRAALGLLASAQGSCPCGACLALNMFDGRSMHWVMEQQSTGGPQAKHLGPLNPLQGTRVLDLTPSRKTCVLDLTLARKTHPWASLLDSHCLIL